MTTIYGGLRKIYRMLREIWPDDKLFLLSRILRSFLRKIRQLNKKIQFKIWSIHSNNKFGKFRTVEAHGEHLVVRTNDWRGYWIYHSRGTQKNLLSVWGKLAEYRPEVCIDVGSNYGEFSIFLRKFNLPVIAIEANPLIYECLRKTLAGYKNLRAFNVAAYNKNTKICIFVKEKMSGYSSLLRDIVKSQVTPANITCELKSFEVQAISLDNLLKTHFGKIPNSFILKIDVEGFEDLVIEGAKESIQKADWWRAIVEYSQSPLIKRGVNPQIIWENLRCYPGIVINENSNDLINIDILGKHLPKLPPKHCNVLIGIGNKI